MAFVGDITMDTEAVAGYHKITGVVIRRKTTRIQVESYKSRAACKTRNKPPMFTAEYEFESANAALLKSFEPILIANVAIFAGMGTEED